jgi:hypothetical protein
MSLDSRAEILKLARLLGTGPDRLQYLAGVDAADLRSLREQMTDFLFDANLATLQRMALASKLVPAQILAVIAERAFGPLLCARIAGLVDVARGVDVARRLSVDFLADVAAELDPRRAGEIVARMPTDAVIAVARELLRREDWITIGRFVGHLPDQAVRASLAIIPDPALLQVAFVLDDKAGIDDVIGLLPAARLDGVMRSAAENDLWPAALDLLGHVSEARHDRLAAALAKLDARHRAEAARLARELGVYDQLGPFRDALAR